MSRMYAVVFEDIAVSAVQDLFELTPADDKPIRLHEVHITDIDGETDEKLQFAVRVLGSAVTSGSGGASVTPTPLHDRGDTAAGFAAERNNTTVATTSGSSYTLHNEGASMLVGLHYVPTEAARPVARQAEAIVVRLIDAPGAARNLSGVAIVEEL